ncbi:MAG: hypothetical protein KF795_08945 [Labilithrix sp.]|nr:hypothetical protein [Labilithrix sp.]
MVAAARGSVFVVTLLRRPSTHARLGMTAALLGALFLLPRTARAAEEQPFAIGPKSVWYLLGGVTTGGTLLAKDRGGYVGGEASLVRLGRAGRFFGFYGDGYYDFGAKRTYTTAGFELGYKLIGIDGGAAARLGGDRPEWGPTGRLFIGVGILSAYGRYAYFIDALGANNAHVVQVGALVKVPMKVWGLE